MANPSSSRLPARGGEEPVIAKGPFFIFLLMMPAFLLIIGMLLVAMQYKQLHAFASERPMALESVPVSLEAQEQVHAKVRDFFAGAGDTLALSSLEIEHLGRTSKLLSDLHLDYHFSLADTLLVARNSLPISSLRGGLGTLAAILRVKGYLNSEMRGYPDIQDGKITMVPVAATMNGMPAPSSVLIQKGPLDIREWVADKDFYDQALAHLAAVKIRNGRLLLIKKRKP